MQPVCEHNNNKISSISLSFMSFRSFFPLGCQAIDIIFISHQIIFIDILFLKCTHCIRVYNMLIFSNCLEIYTSHFNPNSNIFFQIDITMPICVHLHPKNRNWMVVWLIRDRMVPGTFHSNFQNFKNSILLILLENSRPHNSKGSQYYDLKISQVKKLVEKKLYSHEHKVWLLFSSKLKIQG